MLLDLLFVIKWREFKMKIISIRKQNLFYFKGDKEIVLSISILVGSSIISIKILSSFEMLVFECVYKSKS